MTITTRHTIPVLAAVLAATAAIVAATREPPSLPSTTINCPTTPAPGVTAATAAAFDTSRPLPGQPGQPGTFTVVGSATLEVAPDTAELHVRLSARAKRPGKATEQVRAQQAKLLEALGAIGIASADIALAHVTIQQVWDYERQRLDGYEAAIAVTATTTDFDQIGAMMDAAADAGATDISSAFRADLSALKKRVRDLALHAARDKAEQTAGALGLDLGKITAVAESVGDAGRSYWGEGYYYTNRFVANAVEQVPGTSTSLTAAELQPLTLSITVTYQLE